MLIIILLEMILGIFFLWIKYELVLIINDELLFSEKGILVLLYFSK